MARVIKFKDELTIDNVSDEIKELRKAVATVDEITVDLNDTSRVDLAALQMLVAAQKECMYFGRQLTVTRPQHISNMLGMMGMVL